MKTLRFHGFSQRPRFEQVVGYIERGEPLPLDQPDRKATLFVTSHFYLDDFAQSSEDPNAQPLQHTPLRAILEEGFRTPAEATDEDVRLARMYQGYGETRLVEDDLAGDPEADALANNGQGPPFITGRLRSAADGARQQRTLWAQEQQGSQQWPGRSRVHAPKRAAPSGPAAAASADHWPTRQRGFAPDREMALLLILDLDHHVEVRHIGALNHNKGTRVPAPTPEPQDRCRQGQCHHPSLAGLLQGEPPVHIPGALLLEVLSPDRSNMERHSG